MTYQQKNSISNHVNMWRFDGFLGPPTLFTVAGFTRHEATSEYLGILHCEEKSHWREEADDEEAMIPEGKAKKLSDHQFFGGKTL